MEVGIKANKTLSQEFAGSLAWKMSLCCRAQRRAKEACKPGAETMRGGGDEGPGQGDGGLSGCCELQRLLNTQGGQHHKVEGGKGTLHSQCGHPAQGPLRVRLLERVVTSAAEADMI